MTLICSGACTAVCCCKVPPTLRCRRICTRTRMRPAHRTSAQTHTQHACWMLSSRVIRQCQVLKRIQRHRQTQHRCNHLTHIPSHCHARLTFVTSVRQCERVQRAVVCRERDASRACTGSHQSHTAHACTRVTTAVSNVERRERKRCWHGRLDKCDAKVLVQWLGGRRARTHRHRPAQRHA